MYYESSSQDSIQAKEWSDTVGGVGKGVDRVINVPKEEDVGASYDLEQECKWGDASLIDCDVLKAVKSILGEVARLPKSMPNGSKKQSGTCVPSLKGADDQDSLGHRSRRKGVGKSGNGSKDGRLHVVVESLKS